jgi:hypothetical protein
MSNMYEYLNAEKLMKTVHKQFTRFNYNSFAFLGVLIGKTTLGLFCM